MFTMVKEVSTVFRGHRGYLGVFVYEARSLLKYRMQVPFNIYGDVLCIKLMDC